MDDEYHTSPFGWLFCTILSSVVGIAYCSKGIGGIIAGQSTQTMHNDDGTVVYDETFLGTAALVYSSVEIAFGLSLILLGILVPKANDPVKRQLNIHQLPSWQRRLLIGATVTLTVSLLWMCLGPFL